jgi:hypothetical protein
MERKNTEINISQVQTICFLLKKQIEETKEYLKENEGDKYMKALLETYKDALIKFYYISEATNGILLTETDKAFSVTERHIKEGLFTEEEIKEGDEEYFQQLVKIHGV